MKIIADTHTHTNACAHAYSTLAENVRAAAEKGLKFLAVTEHGPAMPDGPHEWYFHNLMGAVPDRLFDVVVLKGCEANILDYNGTLDIPERYISTLDWVIASMHAPILPELTVEEVTRCWMEVAKNPHVDVIGHCGDSRFLFDYEKVMPVFAQYSKIVEINAHSFECRPGTEENCVKIIRLCKQYGVRVVVSSDAHFFTRVGDVQASVHKLMQEGFPEELILNADTDRFLAVAREKTGRILI